MEQWQMEMSGWYPEFQALRHRLHREPERSFQEHGTTQLIRELLTGWGAEVEEHPGWRPASPPSSGGRTPAPPSPCGRTSTPFPWGRTPVCPSPPAGRGSVTPAATTSTPPPCSGPPRPVQAPGPPPRVGQADLPVCRGGGSRRGADAGPGRSGTGPPGSGGGLSL